MNNMQLVQLRSSDTQVGVVRNNFQAQLSSLSDSLAVAEAQKHNCSPDQTCPEVTSHCMFASSTGVCVGLRSPTSFCKHSGPCKCKSVCAHREMQPMNLSNHSRRPLTLHKAQGKPAAAHGDTMAAVPAQFSCQLPAYRLRARVLTSPCPHTYTSTLYCTSASSVWNFLISGHSSCQPHDLSGRLFSA